MATGPRYKVPMKRRREGKTNYHTRLSLLISEKNRIVIRKSTKNIQIQLIKYGEMGDITYNSSISTELKKYGYISSKNNIPASYLTGLLFGYKSIKNGFNSGILDIGLHPSTKGSKLYSALKGMIDSGMNIPHNEKIFPPEEKINGIFIDKYHGSNDIQEQFKKAKENIEKEYR